MSSEQVRGGRARIALCGAGSLGRAFLRQLRDLGDEFQLVAVLTAHHGQACDSDGLDPSLMLNLIEAEGLETSLDDDLATILEKSKPTHLVECIPQNIRNGEPALGFLRAALDQGINVVSANKSAIVLGYRDLLHRASKSGAGLRFEATVLDGFPLFSAVKKLGPSEIVSVRGVLNGTSSLVLESLQHGSTRSRGLARAQALGIAEADSVLDLDGWDAAAKAALLANVWMGGALRVFDVVRSGCETVKDEDLKDTIEDGHYRLLAEITKSGEGPIKATVAPTMLEASDPLFSLTGASGGLCIETTAGQKYAFIHGSPGLESAAEGLVRDCRALA